ncbi:hypothetical protein [Galbibacter sp. BG1]
MKKKSYKKLIKQLKSELASKNGLLKSAGYNCNGKPMQKGEFLIADNDELMFTISFLLKTCVLALEGDANFSLSSMNKADPKVSVIVSLEFIITLLPREQMVLLDKISEIVNSQEY